MPLYKFTISRRSINNEVYEVEADSAEEALEMCYNGEIGDPYIDWCNWYDDRYEIDDQETLDPLVKMLEEYKPQIG